ncbi:MAG: DUF3185 domain-containing protein [Gammaproteobacteria bacterium]|nr:DUF3185 domain-containing protein [Gammaproteobacteria bacterium]
MKSITSLIGLILIIVGIVAFAYQGITYTQREKVAEIGNLKITADTEKTIYFPPVLSGLCLVAGLVLVVIGRKSN